ncbi:MAG: metallopeptidase [Verrucomicrobiales bacterium]|nr:metallopeptidase [Verrucomicrobiales bacterium]
MAQESKKSKNKDEKKIPAVRFDPVLKEMEGWTVHVDPALLEGEHAEEGAKALRMLGDHLNRIVLLMDEERLEKLRTCEIWIERHHPTLGAMQYHPSKKWLEDNGHDPRLEKKVHIVRAKALLDRGQLLKHPAVVLHELAHAYHDQILDFNHRGIREAWDAAMKEKKYDKVLLFNGRFVKHYATTNHKEYFAESTEAYFYRNDFYPFVRAELKEHDPVMHDLMEKIWGKLN